MKRWLKQIALALAVLLAGLTFYNATWLAPTPRGYIKLIAHRGVMQQFDHRELVAQDCTVRRIEPPVHPYLENTVPGIVEAKRTGAQMIAIDIAPTSDGKIALFHDWTLDCRTNGKGETRAATLPALKELDAGYGYTADGGKTFPLRGKGVGMIPSLEEALAAAGDTALLYNFKGRDQAEAERLIAALKAAGRDPVARGDGFSAHGMQAELLRAAFPKAWIFTLERIKACTMGYLKTGWLGMMPDACRNGTIAIPLNYQWGFAGWPNRLIARMEAVGAKVLVIGPYRDNAPIGLDLPEQLGTIPNTFNGYVWVDDIYSLGPALRPAYNKRRDVEEEALAKALDARRKARE